MKRATILSCLCLAFSLAKAQGPVALTAGVSSASVTPNFLNYPDTAVNTRGTKTGFTVGFVANLPLQNGLYFHTGVLYSTKGSRWFQLYDTLNVAKTDKEQLLSANTFLDLAYIEIPLNLMYKTQPHGKTRFVMGAGPQLSMLYTGKVRTNSTHVSQESPDAEVEYRFKQETNEDLPIGHIPGRYRIVHLTANTFAGFEFGRVFLTANYSVSLNAFYQEEDRYYRHQAVGARLGIYMGKRTTAGKSK